MQLQQEINDLIRDKENLKTEVFQLQQQLTEKRDRSSTRDSESSGDRDQEVLDKYKPNNPLALQRKIGEYCCRVTSGIIHRFNVYVYRKQGLKYAH